MRPSPFFEQENNKLLNLSGVQSIPSFYENEANKKWWKYVIGYHYKINPHHVEQWDNDTIIETLASLKMLGVIK